MAKFTSFAERFNAKETLKLCQRPHGTSQFRWNYKETLKAENSLAHASGPGDCDRLIVFTTEANLDILER